MSKAVLIDNMPKFVSGSLVAMDRAFNRMAIDIERLSKQQVPVGPTKKQNKNSKGSGQLRSSGHHLKVHFMRYIIYYNMEYARFQEFGGDKKRKVRRYTKPGSKKFYLKDPGDLISSRAVQYLLTEIGKVKIL